MESVPEKRFSGQNLAVCFWIEVEDLPNILFPQALFFLVGGMLCAFFLTGWILAERDGTTWLRSNLLVVLSLLALGFSVTVTALGLYNARQPYIEFAEKWDVVDTQIRQAQTAQLESVTIPAMDNWAGLERPNDNAKYWPTVCYSVYYDIQVFGPPYP